MNGIPQQKDTLDSIAYTCMPSYPIDVFHLSFSFNFCFCCYSRVSISVYLALLLEQCWLALHSHHHLLQLQLVFPVHINDKNFNNYIVAIATSIPLLFFLIAKYQRRVAQLLYVRLTITNPKSPRDKLNLLFCAFLLPFCISTKYVRVLVSVSEFER